MKERKVEVKCCLIEVEAGLFREVPENEAKNLFSHPMLYRYMDSTSWGNILKVSAEREGLIKEYEQFPCVEE